MNLFRKAKTKEEQEFYVMLFNLVLKREGQKVIGKQHDNIYNVGNIVYYIPDVEEKNGYEQK